MMLMMMMMMALEVFSPWMWVVTTLVVLAVAIVTAFGSFTQERVMIELPRGSWSLPFLGEAVQIWSQGLHRFLIDHYVRFGDPFGLSLFGRTIIVMNTPESIKNVLSTSDASFSHGYPENFSLLIGNGRFIEPQIHPQFKKLTLAIFALGNRRGDSLAFINSRARETVDSWEGVGIINTCDEITKLAQSVVLQFAWADMTTVENIREDMECIAQALVTIRINLPYFCWYRALKAKESLKARVQESVANRRKQGSLHEDFLGGLMKIKNITDDELCNTMVAVLFAGYSTIAILIPWILKYLHNNPTVQDAIQAEQDGLREQMNQDSFFETFSVKECMPLTSQVVDEVLRIRSISAVVPRQTQDIVAYKGIVIPKDVTVWASTYSLHMNPEIFPNPTGFNPSRFENPPKPNTFMPFGAGPHICPGSNLAKAEAVFVVHHLTKYRWKSVGVDSEDTNNLRNAMKPKDGFPIIVQIRTAQS